MSEFDYDKTSEFENEIAPLVEKLHDLCAKHGLPALFCIAFARKQGQLDEGVWYHSGSKGRAIAALETAFKELTNLDDTEHPPTEGKTFH